MIPYHTLLVVLVQMGTWVMVSNVDPNVLHVTDPKKFVLNPRIAKLSVILLVKMDNVLTQIFALAMLDGMILSKTKLNMSPNKK